MTKITRPAKQKTPAMDSMETAKSSKADLETGVSVESDLQSGSLINNEKPGFKLEKRMIIVDAGSGSSKSGITNLQSTQDYTDEGQESFEVVEKDVSNPEQYTSYILIPKKNKAPDYDAMISSLTAEEMKTKLKELLQENVKLQKTSERNNSVMLQSYPISSTAKENAGKICVTEQQFEDSPNQTKTRYATVHVVQRDVPAASKENPNKTQMTEQQTEGLPNQSKNGYTEFQIIQVPKKSDAPSSHDSKKAQASEGQKDRSVEQEKEIKILREWIKCLEQRLNIGGQESTPTIIIQSKDTSNSAPLVNRLGSPRLQQDRTIFDMLSESHIKQGSYYTKVQERLKKSIGVMQGLENVPSSLMDAMGMQHMLTSCKAILQKEVQAMMKEMKELVEIQNEFQGYLSKYDFLLTAMAKETYMKSSQLDDTLHFL